MIQQGRSSSTIALLNNLQRYEHGKQLEEEEEREHFGSYFTYLLSVIGFAVGYGSFWRFPYLVYRNGGGVFLIPYILALVFLGMPMLYLETAVGQMHQKSIPQIYYYVNKGFKMIGYIIIIIAFNVGCYYNMLLTYCYRYIFSTFQNPLPFTDEPPTDDTYFTNVILQRSDSINEFGTLHWELVILYLFSLYVCYQIVKRGLKIGGRVLIFTVITPYVFFIILVLKGMTLSGAGLGVQYLFTPDWSKLLGSQIWIDATVQVFFQMSIANAGVMNYASVKKRTEPFMTSIYLVPLSIIVCGMLSALIIFMYIGHFCEMKQIAITDLSLSGVQLALNVIPKAISILPWPNLWLFFFCLILVMLGIDTQFGFIEAIIGALEDQYRHKDINIWGFIKIKRHNIKKAVIIAMALFFPFFTNSAGIYYFAFFDNFICTLGLPIGALIELYVFVYIFPFKTLELEVEKTTGEKTPSWISTLLQGKLVPGIIISITALGALSQIMLFRVYTPGKYLFGWFLTLYPIILAYWYWRRNRTDQYCLEFEKPAKRLSEF